MYCPKCGKGVGTESIFCSSCGEKIEPRAIEIPPSEPYSQESSKIKHPGKQLTTLIPKKWLVIILGTAITLGAAWIGTIQYRQYQRLHPTIPKEQAALAEKYAAGTDVPKDEVLAFKWFLKAAEQGDVSSQYQVGTMYEEGRGTQKDLSLSMKFFQLAAEQGFAKAQYAVADAYWQGRGVKTDSALAEKWARKAADQGDGEAMGLLGGMSDAPGMRDKARYWYKKAAEAGNLDVQVRLAQIYYLRMGWTTETDAEDTREAIKWYRKAASRGDKDAIEALREIGVSSDGSMSRDAFNNAVMGKTQREVVALLGSPQSTTGAATMDGPCEIWNYIGATYHPVTKKRDGLVSIRFMNNSGRAVKTDY